VSPTPVDILATPFAIGSLHLERRLLMAPMAGITTRPFRRSVRRWGAGLVFTEMISSHGIVYGNQRTRGYLEIGDDEHPVGFQLFGADPAVMAESALVCVAAGADLVDLNLACPVRKVMKTGAGAALLREPDLAQRVVAAVAAVLPPRVPLTVKLRSGLTGGDQAGVDLAPRLVATGAAAICLHPRSVNQLYRGRADHALTLRLARRLAVPVIASGDVTDGAVCAGLLDGGCAAVMLARAALGRPWLFREILSGGERPALEERLREVRRFVDETAQERGERAVGYLRQFWPRFRRNGTIDGRLVRELMRALSLDEVRDVLQRN
jgi:tRNA-dihydrouridine synthase B